MKKCLEAQGTEIKFGDILFIRSGWMASHASLPPTRLHELYATFPHHKFVGIEQSDVVLRWIWEHFAAVAGDQPSFECWPCPRTDWSLHEVLLSGWGCPIGELFDLEKLAEYCREQKSWSFFVVSEVCNVASGVASPPNILAIF
ncbi:hypothetical protein B0H66DRAFT_116707 [Apodospora peruviana]|uniref:Uncharacterized protein n=1 Tax=Apodospora peruviana TaxID=516989 RepID=A0AAE0MB76_9PEZI|nr:hypothetical protein B0H66DRAFT_116707 [Apodospora peruviana]